MKTTRNNSKSARRAGFTLTEVLLVLAIIGVIAAMVVPNIIGNAQQANIKAAKTTILAMENAVKNFALGNGNELPQGSREEVVALLTTASQDVDGRMVPAQLEKLPKDPWNEVLYYEYPTSKITTGTKPAIWSSGPNKQNEDGGGDDINNWSSQ